MCANYLPSTHDQLRQHFGVAPPDNDYKAEAFPGNMAPMIRLPRLDAMPGDRVCALGMFGIVPHWAEPKLARQTYNARTETVASKPSFRDAWKQRRLCIVPAGALFEPRYDTASGKAERWRIAAADGAPLGIAGIWERKEDGPNGLPLLSFSMLTINADQHPLMQRFHKPGDEKRMVVILAPERYDDWLHAEPEDAADFFLQAPAESLVATADPLPARAPARSQSPSRIGDGGGAAGSQPSLPGF